MQSLKHINCYNLALFVVDVPESPWITITSTNGLIFHDVHQNIIYPSHHLILTFAFLFSSFDVFWMRPNVYARFWWLVDIPYWF